MPLEDSSDNGIKRVLSNPYYCLSSINPAFIEEHTPLISEEEWIQAGENLIKEIGAKEYLRRLLDNLKN